MEYLSLILVGLLAWDLVMGLRESRAQWREVATGRAGIYTLRLLTGLWDREELTRRFGPPDEDFTFAVSTEAVREARTLPRRIFDRRWIEVALFGMAVVSSGIVMLCACPSKAIIIAMVALFYRTLAWGHRVFVLLRCYGQMFEEGRAKLRRARQSPS